MEPVVTEVVMRRHDVLTVLLAAMLGFDCEWASCLVVSSLV
jgi:hypothetical protein